MCVAPGARSRTRGIAALSPEDRRLMSNLKSRATLVRCLGSDERPGVVPPPDFIRDTRPLIEQLRFDVQDILASVDRAVIVGELTTRISATGKVIESAFALILTVSNGAITRFQMLEDSFAVSRAARS